MIFAIPAQNGAPHNHFSKAPQVMIIDDSTRETTIVDIPETGSHCGKKKLFMNIFKQFNVDAVVVRQIGESMLKHLFENQFRVFACPRGMSAEALKLTELSQVTDISFARPSVNKQDKKHCCGHKPQHQHQHQRQNKLSPAESGKLQQIFKIHQ